MVELLEILSSELEVVEKHKCMLVEEAISRVEEVSCSNRVEEET